MASQSDQTMSEYIVRVPKNSKKKYNVMRFKTADQMDIQVIVSFNLLVAYVNSFSIYLKIPLVGFEPTSVCISYARGNECMQ